MVFCLAPPTLRVRLDRARVGDLFGNVGAGLYVGASVSENSDQSSNGAVADVEVDLPRIEAAVKEILTAIGEDPDRDGLLKTPSRVAKMYAEVFSGLREDPSHHLEVQFEAGHDEMVMVRDIAFYSMCEHHLLPFVGKAHVAYVPGENGKITGLSKLARLVDAYARRPQVQERLTSQVADELMDVLEPRGALVVIEAEHLCMSMRGVQKPGSLTLTSAVRGLFLADATRAEALQLIGIGR
jgi:GTP cyclohydrolase I